ncbi:MAG: class I SAM-dependent methyltransferase [Bacteriovorax sp.]|nr:class I SAM-dependent methyltransferase [Bacteriovorax sp.]
MKNLTERQTREKEYYEQFAEKFNINRPIDFSPVDGPLLEKERRPWNSYWRTYEIPVDFLRKQKETQKEYHLLDFGCGPGDNSLRFARAGYKVAGFDICEKNINSCKILFEKNNNSEQGNFLVGVAEKIPFADESFEVVVGIDILHHVDIPKAISEVQRVLKKDGIAIFREPVEVPFFDIIRNTKLVRFLFPNKSSLEAHITEDERKLNKFDLNTIKEIFPNMTIERSLVLSRFDKILRKHDNPKSSGLEKWDYFCSKILPSYGLFGGASVIILKKN